MHGCDSADRRVGAARRPPAEVSVSGAVRQLTVSFQNAEAFQKEYEVNLVNGGVFVASEDPLELRQRVEVELDLQFSDRTLTLQGEVVHQVTAELASSMGIAAGVAVQFDGNAHHVRAQLEPLRTASGASRHQPRDPGRRRSPRTKARVPAHIEGGEGSVAGHTRDLSQTGVLVNVPGRGVPVGERVRLALTHPGSGKSMRVEGVVVRHVETDGGLTALAVEFAPEESEREEVQRFVEGIQASEHTRRLGGIAGDIEEIGVEGLLQMFASSAPAGTLTLRRGEREGLIGFKGGDMHFVRLGVASGMKALVRLLCWREGSFEFHARLDAVEPMDAPLPLEAAVFDGMRMLDEAKRIDHERFPADAEPSVAEGSEEDDLSKVEAAVLDLVRAGFAVRRIIEVIPEPDPEIYRAFESLCDRGVIAF